MSEPEQEPQPKRKFARPRDEVLSVFVKGGWANASAGKADSPHGLFATISIAPNELNEIAAAFEDEIHRIADAHPEAFWLHELVGHYMILEDADGTVTVHQYQSADQLHWDYKVLFAAANIIERQARDE